MVNIVLLLLCAFPSKLDGQIISISAQKCESEGGKCVIKEDCPQYKIIEHIPKTHPDFQKLVRKWNSLVCDQAPPKICCPKTQESLLPKPGECGKKYMDVSRIAGGTTAGLAEFPWAALLGYRKTDGTNDYDYLCGGTLINARYVLTAAHCNVYYSEISIVVLGEFNIEVDPDCPEYCQDSKLCSGPIKCQPKRQVIEVDNVIIHEHFADNLQTGDININDIALVRLKKEAILNVAVQPICLPLNEEETATDIGAENLKTGIVGKDVTVIGWGTNGTGDIHSILQKVKLPIVSTNDCKSQLSSKILPGPTVELNIGPKDICAGAPRKDSCKGDSGGGMFINKPYLLPNLPHIYYITHYQIGITSYGYYRCGTGLPGVYTRVTEFIPWIKKHIIDTSTAFAQTFRRCSENETCEAKENCPYIQQKYNELEEAKSTNQKNLRTSIISQLKSLVCNKQKRAFCCPNEFK